MVVRTAYDAWKMGSAFHPTHACMGTRRVEQPQLYQYQTYLEVQERIVNFASGLKRLGLARGDRVGIYAPNRAEWVITDLACQSVSLVPVPLYDVLGNDAVRYIINHAALPAIVCSADKTSSLVALAAVTGDCESLKIIVECGPTIHHQVAESTVAYGRRSGIEIFSFAEMEAEGATARVQPDPPRPDDLFTIMYTSGTTGVPKGVMVTHANFLASLTGILRQGVMTPTKDDVHLSYLPLAHVFERGMMYLMLMQGGLVCFACGDFNRLADDLFEVKPTIVIGVPRIFNRLYAKIHQKVTGEGWFKRLVFNLGYSSKMGAVKSGEESPMWDSLVFSETAAKVGGRVKLIVSGGAPLSAEVQEFLRVCFCCPVLQIYGLTEVGCITFATLHDREYGHVGPPVASSEIKLVDVPELGYTSRDLPHPRGEICCRGPSVFKGYYQDEALTAEVLDKDGWFHTGDIGRWNENGTLTIIDRRKALFKLSQGEYVSPETVEGLLVTNKFISQVFVHGDSFHDDLVMIVVPDPDVVRIFCAEKGIEDTDFKIQCTNDSLAAAILEEVTAQCKAAKLKGFEIPKALHIEPAPFSVPNGFLTPTYKLKRAALVAYYRREIENMYAQVALKKHADNLMGRGK